MADWFYCSTTGSDEIADEMVNAELDVPTSAYDREAALSAMRSMELFISEIRGSADGWNGCGKFDEDAVRSYSL